MIDRLSISLTTFVFALLLTTRGVTEEKPNILFIFADDWGWGDLSCHGHPYVKTPNIDRLAKEGADFHRFSVASGVCSPSRTAVMTGHFPARYRIDGHFAWVPSNEKRGMPDWLSPKAPLLSRMLQQAGYATAHYGKWHLANDMIPDSPTPDQYGYDDYGAFNCAGEQMPFYEDSARAVKFIEESQQKGKPFFINLWIHEPHTPFHVLPRYQYRFPDLEKADQIYAAVLSHADDRIGEILDALDRLRLADDTLVIFSSDNGPARAGGSTELNLQFDTATGAGYGISASKGITGGRKAYKSALFEGGIGVPFIVRWPEKVAAGKTNDHSMISAVDLLPTFLEVAGAKMPEGYHPDGLSQVKALTGKSKATGREKPLFWKMKSRWPASKAKPYHWVSYAIAHKNWKLLASEKSEHVELYDIVADPLEKRELSKENSEVVKSLLEQLENWKITLPEEADASCFSNLREKKNPPKGK